MSEVIEHIVSAFEQRGSQRYGSEAVTQLEHALQCGRLAMEEDADDSLVTAALLHDIGHILDPVAWPTDDEGGLDDRHESIGHSFLKEHFGNQVADPVLLHVPAKRYLCTKHPEYESTLSPTSRKSYHDQGGRMSEKELKLFESEPYFLEALRLRKWDDTAKEVDAETPQLEQFVPIVRRCLTDA